MNTQQPTTERRRITKTVVEPVPSLDEAQRREMYDLMMRYYSGVSWEQFNDDLNHKQYLIRMLDADGLCCGFSTIQLIPFEYEGKSVLTVFSGDTVIDKACWGQKQLQRAFTQFLVSTKLRNPFRRIYWFLITKGFKTYLLMRNNFASWPNHKEATPGEVQAVLHHVATLKYPENYVPERGVLTFEGEVAMAVRSDYCEVDDEAKKNPDIRYFGEVNSGYVRGEELCCLAKVRIQELLWISLKYGVWHPIRKLLGLRKRKPETSPPQITTDAQPANEVGGA